MARDAKTASPPVSPAAVADPATVNNGRSNKTSTRGHLPRKGRSEWVAGNIVADLPHITLVWVWSPGCLQICFTTHGSFQWRVPLNGVTHHHSSLPSCGVCWPIPGLKDERDGRASYCMNFVYTLFNGNTFPRPIIKRISKRISILPCLNSPTKVLLWREENVKTQK